MNMSNMYNPMQLAQNMYMQYCYQCQMMGMMTMNFQMYYNTVFLPQWNSMNQMSNPMPNPMSNSMPNPMPNQMPNQMPNPMPNPLSNSMPNPNVQNGQMEELLPREDKTITAPMPTTNNNNGMIINITLEASTGLKVIIPISNESTLAELFKIYETRASLPPNVLGDKIVFLYNGGKINPNSTDKIRTLIRGNNAKITVFDQGGVIGA